MSWLQPRSAQLKEWLAKKDAELTERRHRDWEQAKLLREEESAQESVRSLREAELQHQRLARLHAAERQKAEAELRLKRSTGRGLASGGAGASGRGGVAGEAARLRAFATYSGAVAAGPGRPSASRLGC
mmetsp:Transcript_24813/g.70638  ORF Transcript_24813/g.70638 Transcript_24813/m.70638 type:complete len:129 (+) Transcript_24813:575-961(+)